MSQVVPAPFLDRDYGGDDTVDFYAEAGPILALPGMLTNRIEGGNKNFPCHLISLGLNVLGFLTVEGRDGNEVL
jgi:hypothetical protein